MYDLEMEMFSSAHLEYEQEWKSSSGGVSRSVSTKLAEPTGLWYTHLWHTVRWVFSTLSMGLYLRPTTSKLERDKKMIDPGLNLAAPWLTGQFIRLLGCGGEKRERGRPTYPVHSSSLMIADAYSHIAAFHHLVEEWHVTPSATASIAFYYVHLDKRERVCGMCVCACVHACGPHLWFMQQTTPDHPCTFVSKGPL